jgi:hypothetical protein
MLVKTYFSLSHTHSMEDYCHCGKVDLEILTGLHFSTPPPTEYENWFLEFRLYICMYGCSPQLFADFIRMGHTGVYPPQAGAR